MIDTDEDGIAIASRGLAKDLTAFPSVQIHQANAARRQGLLVDATIERRSAHIRIPSSRGTSKIDQAGRRFGWFVLALVNGLVSGDGPAEPTPALKP